MIKEYLDHVPGSTRDEAKAHLQTVEYEGIAGYNVDQMIEGVLARFKGQPSIYVTGSGNFREQVATILPYKGNRDPTHKPKYYKEIKKRLLDKWGAILVHGYEADDAMAIEQWKSKDRDTVICTIDKDLDQVPGFHYNYVKQEMYNVTVADANRFFFWQMLNGDTSDNIPGIKGVGPRTIEKKWKELDYDLDSIREFVKSEYQRQYGESWEAAYHEVGALLWMIRVEGKDCPLL